MPAVAKTNRDTILRAAVARLRQESLGALSLKALATDVGITTNALYHYFPDRAHLEAALANESAKSLHRALRRVLRGKEPILTMARAYLRFARTQPHLYDLLLHSCEDTDECNDGHQELWLAVLASVTELHGEQNAAKAATSLWALLHGAVALERAGVLGTTKPSDNIEYGLRAWMQAAPGKRRRSR